jgi:hypothetical protein
MLLRNANEKKKGPRERKLTHVIIIETKELPWQSNIGIH